MRGPRDVTQYLEEMLEAIQEGTCLHGAAPRGWQQVFTDR